MNIEHKKTIEILKWFEALNQIPRRSKNEEQVGKWLMNWANENNFNAKKDDAGNVLVDIPASPG